MSRVRLVICAVLVAACAVAGGATAAPAPTQQGDFALVDPLPLGHQMTGVGVTGKWTGWMLSLSYDESGDCYITCDLYDVQWTLSSGHNAVWGTCTPTDPGSMLCADAAINAYTGAANFSLLVTGGSGRYAAATGTGVLTGPTGSAEFLPGAPGSAAAVVRLQLTIG